jgi:signal transduction histidine kinase
MNRPTHIWLAFALCFVVLLTAMGGISWSAIRLDDTQRKAEREADLEERVRLALWRMDSTLGILIAEENARPPSDYEAFHVVAPAYSRALSAWSAGEVLTPSPLIGGSSSNVLLHFQFGADGRATSPEVPAGLQRTAALSGHIDAVDLAEAEKRLGELQQLLLRPGSVEPPVDGRPYLGFARAATAAPPPVLNCIFVSEIAADAFTNETVWSWPEPETTTSSKQAFNNPRLAGDAQDVINYAEQKARVQNLSQVENNRFGNGTKAQKQAAPGASPLRASQLPAVNLSVGRMAATWVDKQLLLSRRVEGVKGGRTQGVWLNWPGLRTGLLASIADLLPNADFQQASAVPTTPSARRLVALPVQLVAGAVPYEAATVWTPIRLTLAVAWVGVALAGGAVALLLHGIVSLSERRAAFVSAVTHELRTPLTTFKMYSEMLADGMVTDPAQEAHYLGTLKSESNRLGHLVENVLAYAKLERRSARSRVESVTVGELIERVRERLEQRAAQAEMRIKVDADPTSAATRVRVDVAAVEQILFNLVDNACKYAAPSATERVIHLEALPERGKLALLRVRDHGQGISAAGAKRLFQPFSKSADDAAHSAPGVGLGLALCRRLSRSLGGDLKWDARVTDGACFVLTLPRAEPVP